MTKKIEKCFSFQELAKGIAFLEWKACHLEAQLEEIKQAAASKEVFGDIQQICNRYENARAHKSPHSFKERAAAIVAMFIKSRTRDIVK